MKRAGAPRTLRYHRVPEFWTKIEKLEWLAEQTLASVPWHVLEPDDRHNWLTDKLQPDYAALLPLGSKEAKAGGDVGTIFSNYGRGIATSRDDWAYGFDRAQLATRMQRFIEFYNAEVDRWQRHTDRTAGVDGFVRYDDTQLKWSRDLKLDLQRGNRAVFDPTKIRRTLYRPFTSRFLFFDRVLNEEVYQQPKMIPNAQSEAENIVIIVAGVGADHQTFHCANAIVDVKYGINGNSTVQCFPLYTYDEDGSNRRENITAWALAQFQAVYGSAVTRQQIFAYVYAMLHHPQYRTRYAENLKRELPRVPLVPAREWPAYVGAGQQLLDLHLGYETAREHPLRWIENRDVPFSWRVARMRLSADKTQLVVNPSLTLADIPPAVYDYRLGNRSALEWIIDQYQVSTDRRSGIVSDPNRADDEAYIVRLVGRVVTVSLDTQRIIGELPALASAAA